ncbi:MAG TPA: methylated-DNA--[protein]-cysteine S-methyltransferase [Bacteroidales bacterium]|nr:methylated-DNA--[protein]-cysteine S-methyltransferase [Bacteroidales bacterium]
MIITRTFGTPLGNMIAGSVNDGLCLLEFTDRKMLGTEYKILAKYTGEDITEGSSPVIDQAENELMEYFAGTRKSFMVPVKYTGTVFQMHVWDELLKIPYGTTRSYGRQAEALGGSSSVRAVANANGMNKIEIIIPCHRVIGENGHLTGYGGGLWRKRWLIDHEKKHSGRPVDQTIF